MSRRNFDKAAALYLSNLEGARATGITREQISAAFKGEEARLIDLWGKYSKTRDQVDRALNNAKGMGTFFILYNAMPVLALLSFITTQPQQPNPQPQNFSPLMIIGALAFHLVLVGSFAGLGLKNYFKYRQLKDKPPEQIDAEMKVVLTEIVDEFEARGLLDDLDYIMQAPQSSVIQYPNSLQEPA